MGKRGRSEYFIEATPGYVAVRRRLVKDPTLTGFDELVEDAVDRDVKARGRDKGQGGTPDKGTKQAISSFSGKSRRAMRKRIASFAWDEVGPRLAMVTLTYPREFPMDGRRVKAHLNAFFAAWRREWGDPRAVWALEFQERGAPHIHVYAAMPEDYRREWDEGAQRYVWVWALDTWSRIVNSGDRQHRRWGVDVRPCFYGNARVSVQNVADYFWRESGKWGQKQVPAGFSDVGRFWGYRGLKPVVHEVPVAKGTYVRVRRDLGKLRDKRVGAKVRRPHGLDGLWVLMGDGLAAGVRLVRNAEALGET